MNSIYCNNDYYLYLKTPKKTISYITILILFSICFVVIGNIKYTKYKKYKAVYYNDFIYFETDTLYDLKEMYFDGVKYSYEVDSIDNNDIYYLVKIKSDFSSKWVKNGNYIDIYFVYQKTSVFKEVFNKIWKG